MRRNILYRIVSGTMAIILMLICFVSCRNHVPNTEEKNTDAFTDQTIDFLAINLKSNHQREYCVIQGNSYIQLGKLNHENVLEKIADNLPPINNKHDATVHGITTDGTFLYAYIRIFTYEDNKVLRRTYLYRINPVTGEYISLYDYEQPSVINNNFSLNLFGDYLYFFIPNDAGYNELCRVKTDGSEYEQLTQGNTQDGIYTGMIEYDHVYYLIKNNCVYRTTAISMKDAELFLENITTIELYQDTLYFVRDSTMYRINLREPDKIELCFENIYDSSYVIKENKIYYLTKNEKFIGKNSAGEDVYNPTQGTIYVYDIESGISQFVYENEQLHITAFFNINSQNILASMQTNNERLSESGDIQKYYLLPLDGSEPIKIQDLRYTD